MTGERRRMGCSVYSLLSLHDPGLPTVVHNACREGWIDIIGNTQSFSIPVSVPFSPVIPIIIQSKYLQNVFIY